ncbi:MAG TPA: hypothetical protein VNO81_14270, partial [Candidatus Nitrosotenuis sp.]|nr:hypothetical protein [Candidatus Nitrosotenuis sp.]
GSKRRRHKAGQAAAPAPPPALPGRPSAALMRRLALQGLGVSLLVMPLLPDLLPEALYIVACLPAILLIWGRAPRPWRFAISCLFLAGYQVVFAITGTLRRLDDPSQVPLGGVLTLVVLAVLLAWAVIAGGAALLSRTLRPRVEGP